MFYSRRTSVRSNNLGTLCTMATAMDCSISTLEKTGGRQRLGKPQDRNTAISDSPTPRETNKQNRTDAREVEQVVPPPTVTGDRSSDSRSLYTPYTGAGRPRSSHTGDYVYASQYISYIHTCLHRIVDMPWHGLVCMTCLNRYQHETLHTA